MKVISKITFALLAISLFVACGNKPEGEAAKVSDASKTVATPTATAKSFKVTNGTVYWTGTKVAGSHTGTISVSNGKLAAEGDKITSGSFTIDMNTIKNSDLPEDKQGDLVGHLASADFFDVANHGTGTFEIVSVAPLAGKDDATHTITGNLTLKGITKQIEIPAFVTMIGDELKAVTPKFTINRTDWDIKYGSGIIGTAKDKIISDDISLNIDLTAKAG